ncbi:integrase [Bosea sp. BE125]|uniref:site-specific integrase n=1 Tax=Bosea sp. BE125 TaxID=2817909 RepID=UPI0028593E40|nr:site-specific integrase [Bosea sp. BE125]MDR6873550.1 integrase [Bosea sp. BE125]
MDDVRRIPGTIIRSGIYYLQRRVPSDLVEAFGYHHFKESLKTGDFVEAKRRLNALNVTYDQLIEEKRSGLKADTLPAAQPVPLKLHALLSRIREHVSQQSALRRHELSARKWKLEPGSRDRARSEIVATIEALRDPSDDYTRQQLRMTAIALFPENSFDRPELGKLHNFFDPLHGITRERLRRALLDVERRSLAFLDGDFSGSGLDQLFIANGSAAQPARPTDGTNSQLGITVAKLSEMRLADHAKGSIRAQRKAQLAAAHSLIVRYFGADTDAVSLTPQWCEQFRDLVAELPRDLTKRFSDSAKLDQIVEEARADGLPTLARATQETYLGALRGMMEWASGKWHISRNPAEGLKSLAVDRPRTRVDYDDDLLKAIFAEPFMSNLDRMSAAAGPMRGLSEATRFWAPRIALFTGMRQNEICQLDVSDILRTKSGTHYFFADDQADDKQLKNTPSKKAVPIHARLIEAGLLRYFEVQRGTGQRKLFPDVTQSAYGHYSGKLSKWFNRNLRSAHYPRGVDFHAFRHTFRQALRHVNASEEIAGRLGGWSSNQGVMERYGGALSDRWIDQLNATLQQIDYGPWKDIFR